MEVFFEMEPELSKRDLKNSSTMTVAEAARFMRVARNTIYTMLSEGRLKGFRIGLGRSWRIEQHEVKRFMDSGGKTA